MQPKETDESEPPMTEGPPKHTQIPRPQIGFDWRDWLPYLAESDLSDEDKQAMIEALWAIVLGFIDLGYDVKPTADCCGETLDLKAALAAAVLSSSDTKISEDDAA